MKFSALNAVFNNVNFDGPCQQHCRKPK